MATLIRERYEPLETLGAGGEARVIKALDRQHGRFVALKIRSVRDGEARELLLTEARILLAIPPHPPLPLVREDSSMADCVVAMDWCGSPAGSSGATSPKSNGPTCCPPALTERYATDSSSSLPGRGASSPSS